MNVESEIQNQRKRALLQNGFFLKNMDTVAEWLKALDCKSSDIVYVGSNPARVKNLFIFNL